MCAAIWAAHTELTVGFHWVAPFMLKWLCFKACETQTLVKQKGQLLLFHSNEAHIAETGGGNQTHKL